MVDDLKGRRANYDALYYDLLKDVERARNVKDKRICAGKSRAVLDIVEMLDRMIARADPENDTSEPTEEGLKRVRVYAIEAKERANQPVKDGFTASMCLGYRLGYDLILKDLDTPIGILDLVGEGEDTEHHNVFPLDMSL